MTAGIRVVSRVKRRTLATSLAAVGLFGWRKPVWAADPSGTCGANNTDDIAYLNFWPPLPGTTFFSLGLEDFVKKLGTTGDGKTRQLSIGQRIPVWVRIGEEAKISQTIKESFDRAKRANVAAYFYVDDHIGWDERPDLWNWYDTTRKGYSAGNKNNVEWYDWEETPNKRRYLTPEGTPSASPHMCYNSPAVRQEISRIVSQLVGPALRQEIKALKQQNKEYLFAGIAVGAEAGTDDYTIIAKMLAQIPRNPDPNQAQLLKMLTKAAALMDEDKAPRSRLGYCALKNAGYSKAKPPTDINQALIDVSHDFIEFWNKQFVDAGIPCSRLYTHVAASPPQDADNNAPIRIVFNPYVRPGWTTYPMGTLANGFQPLYDALAQHGNPAWGGVEANTAAFVNPNAPAWEDYLAWHYNHGAKLVSINVGASDRSVMSSLSKGAFGDQAMAAYRKFLNGEPLSAK